MRIPLNLPPGPKQLQFLDQLNAALRAISTISNGSAGFDKDGVFRSITSGFFKLESGDTALSWCLLLMPDGVLDAVEVEPLDDAEPPSGWASDTNAIVTKALVATLAKRQQQFFQRVLFNYIGPALDGEYWLPGGFRFAPALPNDESPMLVNSERVVVFDMNLDAIDPLHAAAIANERARRYAARLSLILNVGLYRSAHESRWALQKTEAGEPDGARVQLGFFKPIDPPTSMPEKGELCKLGRLQGKLAEHRGVGGKPISFPQETRRILRGVDNAAPEVRDGFDRCARLYQVALVCGRFYPSVGFAYRVAAAEAIVKAGADYKSFSDFVRANVAPRNDLDVVLNYLYGRVRSAHFHGGEFPSGEFERRALFDPLTDATDLVRFDLEWRGSDLLREAIVTWISSAILQDSKDEAKPFLNVEDPAESPGKTPGY